MKKTILLVILAAIALTLFAHEPVEPVGAGHVRLALSDLWGSSGAQFHNRLTTSSGDPILLEINIMTVMWNSYVPLACAIELGITDWLSLGAELGLITFLGIGIAENSWILNGSFFCRADLANVPIGELFRYRLNVNTGLQPYPLIEFTTYPSTVNNGLIDWYATIGNSFAVIQVPDFSWYLYADLKNVLTLISPSYHSNMNSAAYWLPELSPAEAAALPVSFTSGGKAGVALGTEVVWGFASLHFGCIIPIITYSTFGVELSSQAPVIEADWRIRL
jgi:hypothetical protein